MELLYLLCSILSTTITTIILSLIHPFFRRNSDDSFALYQGTVWHERRRPVHHSFSYNVRYALTDLDAATHAPTNHLSAHEARRLANTNGPVFLLTIPPSVGYEQNPLSLYYCYDIDGSAKTLTKCIAEVTNTPWGERVTFLFNPKSDLVAKPLHVSPFMDMHGNWSMKTNEPGDNLQVVISVQHPKLGNYFTASLTAKRVDSFQSGDYSGFFWLMPHKVALWIYWHALKLWWKNVAFVQHPRYSNPIYREEALLRDANITCQPCRHSEANSFEPEEKSAIFESSTKMSCSNRGFTWRDAKWPWCYVCACELHCASNAH